MDKNPNALHKVTIELLDSKQLKIQTSTGDKATIIAILLEAAKMILLSPKPEEEPKIIVPELRLVPPKGN